MTTFKQQIEQGGHVVQVDKTPFITDNKQVVMVHIPICCREGWPTCPHIAQKPEKVRRNIAL